MAITRIMSFQLELHKACLIDEVSLTLVEDVTEEQWREIGFSLSRIGKAHQWWTGDWLAQGEARFRREMYDEAEKITNLSRGYLRVLCSVSKRFQKSLYRYNELSWKHHQLVLDLDKSLTDDDAQELLKEAAMFRWPVSKLEAEIKLRAAGGHRTEDWHGGNETFLYGDLLEKADEVGRADLIFTDPPYADMEAYRKLGVFAARVLKNPGVLVCYSGQEHLPKVIGLLAKELTYWWCGALWMGGEHLSVMGKKIWNRFKPLLFFVKGKWEPPEWFLDGQESPAPEKGLHEWQQSVAPAEYFLSRLCGPEAIVCDPFLGAATTAIAAKCLGLSFVGIERDAEALAISVKRIRESGDD